MTKIELLVDDLIRDEGERLKVYTDTVGKLTIGVGRNLTDVGISRDESRHLLMNDISAVVLDLGTFPWWAGLDPVRKRALANFRFNVGGRTFRTFKATLAAVAQGDYDTAANQLVKSKWYGQVGSRGKRIVRMMRTGEVP